MVENAKGFADTNDFFEKVKSKTGEDYDDVNKTLPPVEDGESSSQTPPN